MTSLAELGEIAKASAPPADDVSEYRRGIVQRLPIYEDDAYYKRGAGPMARRQGKEWGGAIGGAAAGLGAGAGLAALTRGKSKRPVSASMLPALGAGVGAGTGGFLGARSNFRNDDTRVYNKDTGLRRHPGWWRAKTYEGGTR